MKSTLRELYRARRRAFAADRADEARPALNTNLRLLLKQLDRIRPGAQTCAYAALSEEAPVDLEAPWFLPVVRGDELEFRSGGALTRNHLGVTEPARGSLWIETSPTVVACPAVAVDWRGGRLGMGKSFYDRFFTRHPGCVRVGVVYHVQISKDPLPAEGWDEPLDWIVTEKMILRTQKRSLPAWT